MNRRIILIVMIVNVIFLFVRCKKDEPTTVADVDGNVYHMITIGKQVWTVENLKTTKYNDGSKIPLVADATEWWNLTTPGYCWYNDGVEDKKSFGPLYNWYAVNTNKLCPLGWHVPSDDEWKILTDYLGGENIAGGKLKETGSAHWINNVGATNTSGFTALPGGMREADPDPNIPSRFIAVFWNFGTTGYWWSSTVDETIYAWFRELDSPITQVTKSSWSVRYGFSVRCLKN